MNERRPRSVTSERDDTHTRFVRNAPRGFTSHELVPELVYPASTPL